VSPYSPAEPINRPFTTKARKTSGPVFDFSQFNRSLQNSFENHDDSEINEAELVLLENIDGVQRRRKQLKS
jgi:hypothetical protein